MLVRDAKNFAAIYDRKDWGSRTQEQIFNLGFLSRASRLKAAYLSHHAVVVVVVIIISVDAI